MSLFYRLGAYFLLKRPIAGLEFIDVLEQCREMGHQLAQALPEKADSEQNARILSHIIGIEKWGQNRLQVALGKPLVADDYLAYRPDRAITFPELCEQFPTVRSTTIALGQKILENGATAHKVPHNQFGDLDCKSWIRYLTIHADREGTALK